jgi:hypothetical protein
VFLILLLLLLLLLLLPATCFSEQAPKTISFALSASGLPDGIFSNQKIQIWVNFGRP